MIKGKKTYTLQVPINEELYTAFKMECLKNRQSIKDAVTDLLNYYVNPPKMTKNEAKN